MFNTQSYEKHKTFIDQRNDEIYVNEVHSEGNPLYNYNSLFFVNIAPLIKQSERWLTVGDYNGIDAAYIKRMGGHSTATDLSIKVLEQIILPKKLIDACAIQNVENMTFESNSFDYVCCKEAYHHFPRPSLGFYEMLRVAKKGVIILEPNDIGISFPVIVGLRNILDKINTKWLRKIWKNQYSYEIVGNFVYKVSFREFEKMAVGLDLPMIAVKGFNSNSFSRAASDRRQRSMKFITDSLSKLSIIPFQNLSIVVFKEIPDNSILEGLKKSGYKIHTLPKNPYNN